MKDFAERAAAYLTAAEKQYQPPFAVTHDVLCCERQFPMVAQYEKRDDRYFMQIKGSIAQASLCGEKCFFDVCETLDDAAWEKYTVLFCQLQDTQVPAEEPDHDFTLISFVLCTGQLDRRIQKKIKKYKDYRQYSKEKYGWSALRLCVVDLQNGTYTCNDMGKGVQECLTRTEFPQENKKSWFSFGK